MCAYFNVNDGFNSLDDLADFGHTMTKRAIADRMAKQRKKRIDKFNPIMHRFFDDGLCGELLEKPPSFSSIRDRRNAAAAAAAAAAADAANQVILDRKMQKKKEQDENPQDCAACKARARERRRLARKTRHRGSKRRRQDDFNYA